MIDRRSMVAGMACVPVAMTPVLAFAGQLEPPKPVEPQRPLRIYSLANGDKLTIKTFADGSMKFEWEAKEDLEKKELEKNG